MQTLKETLTQAEKDKKAIGHFNAPNIEIITAIINAALKTGEPAVIGFSEGERDFFRIKQAVDYVRSVREETGHPIFVNADHTYSLKRVKEAIDTEFDSVIWDGADKSYEENRDTAKEVVEYARASGKDVLVEAELGFIGGGSNIKEAPPEGAAITEEMMTKPDEAKRFVEETGIDLLAPAVGNLHGLLKAARIGAERTRSNASKTQFNNPKLNIERIREIREAAGVPLVLHGGSGISDEDFRAGIMAGLAQIHVSTELRIAYHEALHTAMRDNDDHELAPYKLMKPVVKAVQNVVEEKMRLFRCGATS